MSKKKIIIDVHKFADIDNALIPDGLKEALEGLETYRDTVPKLEEHIYSMDFIWDENQQKRVFNDEQETYLSALHEEMRKKDIDYFRIIKP